MTDGDDADIVKYGSWLQSNNLFDGRVSLYYYWVFLSIFGTVLQIVFFYFILINFIELNEKALKRDGLTDEEYRANLDVRYC